MLFVHIESQKHSSVHVMDISDFFSIGGSCRTQWTHLFKFCLNFSQELEISCNLVKTDLYICIVMTRNNTLSEQLAYFYSCTA